MTDISCCLIIHQIQLSVVKAGACGLARIDDAGRGMQVRAMNAVANYKIGNEKLVRVLDGASSHLRGLLERQGRPEGALRIAVVGGGCSGLQYKMDLVDGPRDRDILVPSNGVNVVIDPKSALFVSGSELDFSDDLQQGGFKVSNPNAVVTCSCGESFAA
jgi:iron-sulfur cluster assembly protein